MLLQPKLSTQVKDIYVKLTKLACVGDRVDRRLLKETVSLQQERKMLVGI